MQIKLARVAALESRHSLRAGQLEGGERAGGRQTEEIALAFGAGAGRRSYTHPKCGSIKLPPTPVEAYHRAVTHRSAEGLSLQFLFSSNCN